MLALLSKWYATDDNNVPPSVKLVPVSTHFPINSPDPAEAQFAWEQWHFEESRLRGAFLLGQPKTAREAKRYPTDGIVDMVLRQATTGNNNCNKQVFVFQRSFKPDAAKPEHRAYEQYFDTQPEDINDKRALDEHLRHTLSKGRIVAMPNVEWDPAEGLVSQRYLDVLSDAFCDRVIEDILSSYQNVEVDQLYQEVVFHRQQLQAQLPQPGSAAYFLPRADVQAPLQAHLELQHHSAKLPIIIAGKQGSGKTWLVSDALAKINKSHPDVTLVYRFCGSSLR